jgi:hypothetical protein
MFDRINITVSWMNTTALFGCTTAAYCLYYPENTNVSYGCGSMTRLAGTATYNATTIPLNRTGLWRLEANCTDGGGDHYAEPRVFLIRANTTYELLQNVTREVTTHANTNLGNVYSALFTNRSYLERIVDSNFSRTNTAMWRNATTILANIQETNLTTLNVLTNQSVLLNTIVFNDVTLFALMQATANEVHDANLTIYHLSRNQTLFETRILNISDRVVLMNASVTNILNDLASNTTFRFRSLDNNVSLLYNDTQTLLGLFNCTISNGSGVFLCDRLMHVNTSVSSLFGDVADIRQRVIAANATLKDLLFLEKAVHQTYQYDLVRELPPREGWDEEYRIALRGTGITANPLVRLRVPVARLEDVQLEHQGRTFGFDFREGLFGNVVEFRPQLLTCASDGDLNTYEECPASEYRLSLRHLDNTTVATFSLAKEINRQVADARATAREHWLWVMGGIALVVFCIAVVVFVVMETGTRSRS